MISAANVQRLLVGRQNNCVRAVFVSTLQQAKVLGRVILVITIGVAHPMQTNFWLVTAIRHDIQTVKGTQESLSHSDVDVDWFNFDRVSGTDRRRSDTVQLAVLV